jgi:hypothetical protein
MFNPFKTKYRICQYWTTSVDKVSGVTSVYDQHYKVEYRNLSTILFGETWRSLTFDRFESYDDAKSYLQKYINDKYKKTETHKKVMLEVEP